MKPGSGAGSGCVRMLPRSLNERDDKRDTDKRDADKRDEDKTDGDRKEKRELGFSRQLEVCNDFVWMTRFWVIITQAQKET